MLGGSAVAVGTLGTGESIDTIKSKVKRAVKDKDRTRAVHELLDQWQAEGKDYHKATAASRKKVIELVKRHDATRADFEALNADLDARDAKTIEEFLNMRASIKQRMTSEEWQAVFNAGRS